MALRQHKVTPGWANDKRDFRVQVQCEADRLEDLPEVGDAIGDLRPVVTIPASGIGPCTLVAIRYDEHPARVGIFAVTLVYEAAKIRT